MVYAVLSAKTYHHPSSPGKAQEEDSGPGVFLRHQRRSPSIVAMLAAWVFSSQALCTIQALSQHVTNNSYLRKEFTVQSLLWMSKRHTLSRKKLGFCGRELLIGLWTLWKNKNTHSTIFWVPLPSIYACSLSHVIVTTTSNDRYYHVCW